MTFDPNKPCATNNADAVRILATDLSDPAPIGVLIFGPHGTESFRRFRVDGKAWDTDEGEHLVNIESAKYSVMRNGLGTIYTVEASAPPVWASTPQLPTQRIVGLVLTYVGGKLNAEVTP